MTKWQQESVPASPTKRGALSTAEIQPIAARLFTAAAARHRAEIQAITDHGYGAYLYGLLADEAWVCAQKGCEIAWPADRIKPILEWKRQQNAPVVGLVLAVQPWTIPPETLALFNAGRYVAPPEK